MLHVPVESEADGLYESSTWGDELSIEIVYSPPAGEVTMWTAIPDPTRVLVQRQNLILKVQTREAIGYVRRHDLALSEVATIRAGGNSYTADGHGAIDCCPSTCGTIYNGGIRILYGSIHSGRR
jgi:hypothetical protein